jgi:hypothetical protein
VPETLAFFLINRRNLSPRFLTEAIPESFNNL